MEVFVSAPSFRCSTLMFPDDSVVRHVLDRFTQQQGGSSDHFYVTRNGRLVSVEDPLQHGAVYHLEPRLSGGKGGFGSMLRALGAQIEKTTNREACRDLSGRRLRDVNHEKEMAEWLKKQAEREAEKEQRRVERLQRKLSEPKHQFTDPEYQQQCHDLSERLEDSVMKGLQVSSGSQVKMDDVSADKRPNRDESEQPKQKKACFWTGVGDLEDLLSSEDEESPSTSSSGCGVAAVTMTTPAEEADPEQSTSRPSPDQSPPGAPTDQSSRPPGGQRPPGAPTDQSSRPPGDQRAPTDQSSRPPGGQRPPGAPTDQSSRPPGDQSSPGAPTDQSSRPPGDQRAPADQSSRPPGDQSPPEAPTYQQVLDLSSVASAGELESLGLDVLKAELMSRGLKCGGTLTQRAARLFSVRGLTPDQIDPALLTKPGKAKRK